ncbi:MAG: hypothetical protein ACMUEM_06165 [Flavobacteriales bacterium AspAUS03]
MIDLWSDIHPILSILSLFGLLSLILELSPTDRVVVRLYQEKKVWNKAKG